MREEIIKEFTMSVTSLFFNRECGWSVKLEEEVGKLYSQAKEEGRKQGVEDYKKELLIQIIKDLSLGKFYNICSSEKSFVEYITKLIK